MHTFLLIISISAGLSLILTGKYFKKNTYCNKPRLIKKATPETAQIYNYLISRSNTITGISIIFISLAGYILKSDLLMICALLIPGFASGMYALFQEKVITQKVPTIPVTLMIILFVVIIFALGAPYIETGVKIDDKQVKFSGIYSEKIQLQQVEKIQLLDTIPPIYLRTNGVSIGGNHKGYYSSRPLKGNLKLLLNSNQGPFIHLWLHTPERYVIVNFKDCKKTTDIYNQLKTATESVKNKFNP